ncbi:cation:proton antiporter [Pseudonocardia sp. KRD-169]|uniref:Cation:proton antiporter n=2 Tax=Pseudonocardia abyssalis TaxID=2792008 RepID=A0ABS6UT77_9PSEU|nr:cation:proton antiporter [Pseudonocardia abyssalis]MBW0135459.1 cation:proton antiporter [Pseudonocardia abyssalis]
MKHVIAYVLLDVAIVVVAARLTGRLFRRFGQPAVIGEIVAGVALGPTLLGAFPGDLDQLLFPPDVRPFLSVIAQLGLALFMFIVGLEVDLSLIRGRRRAAGAVAAGSVVLPFALGAGVAVVLYPFHSVAGGETVSPLAFVLFMGVAMSITALPVLARILTERGMQRTPIGVLALACAAIDDVIGWTLLAVVVAVAAGGSAGGALVIMGWTLLFALVMFFGVRPLLARLVTWHARAGRLTPDILAIVLAGLLASAWITEIIGVHAIFGAFLFGAVMPRREAAALTREILERLEQVSLLLLLPVFFVVAGLQVDVGAIGLGGIWQLALILVAAIAGKFLGAAVAARAQGMPRRQSTALGLLMNTRGLTEIVILQVGLQLGVLGPAMFTLMVIMALVTTAMTGPLMTIVYPDRVLARELAAAERAELGEVDAFTVLAVVDDPVDGRRVAELARDLTGRQHPARVVLCRLLPAQVELEVASGLGAELGMIAAAGDELRVLAAELEACGTPASVVARFGTDPAALAGTLDADLVLLTGDADVAVAALAAVPETTVVVARFGTGEATGTPLALVDGAAGGRAVLRVAAHLALRTSDEVAVDSADGRGGTRRTGAAADALTRRGITARPARAGEIADASVVVLPDSADLPVDLGERAVVLRVRASGADVDDDLDQSLARITVAPTAPTP